VHNSVKAHLTSVVISGSPPKFNHLFIGPLLTFLNISCKSIRKFLHKVANRQIDKCRRKHNLLGGGSKAKS